MKKQNKIYLATGIVIIILITAITLVRNTKQTDKICTADCPGVCAEINSVEKTFCNTCKAGKAHAKIIYKGPCKMSQLNPSRPHIVQKNESFYKCPNNGEYMASGEHKWIDCMPPTTYKFCKPNYRNWIQKNCLGIEFLD